jgi:hypothetical protein
MLARTTAGEPDRVGITRGGWIRSRSAGHEAEPLPFLVEAADAAFDAVADRHRLAPLTGPGIPSNSTREPNGIVRVTVARTRSPGEWLVANLFHRVCDG